MEDEDLIQYFRDELAAAGIQDRYQHDLYLEQGVLQLTDFLTKFRQNPVPKVLHTEEFFDVKVGDIKVVGRIDRVDQWLMVESSSPITRPERLNPRKIPTRACSFPSMPWRPREVGISRRSSGPL